MTGFSVFIAIITLVVSILQIILFFKIWKMTNDASDIKEALNIILIKNLPENKRKEAMLKAVSKELNKFDVLTEYYSSKEIVGEKIEDALNNHNIFIQDMREMYKIPNEYTHVQLKNDLVKLFSHFIK